MPAIRNYEELVYAGVLGKVIGVYMGRPFEGWTKENLEKKWGLVDRYVHEDQGVPLVVSDDDISGTLTFIRALEDTGLYAGTPAEAFGDAWMNYLIEGKTVLWWGGLGRSTEHTAYLRLKHGIRAPRSGSIETNGPIVAEQIGAQIFIDAFGLVAPGDPELAARLARRSASVSHDGEAVNGALVVAAMVSGAFVEKDMSKLLDIGVRHIPPKSLIAQVHRDVRAWCRADRDWRKTHDRIRAQYGYDKYRGGCHMVPNHAIMVLAWCSAPDDFHRAQAIINTSGWDTDCNAANVGSVMGVKVGLAGINARYDFQSPFADRMLVPTAEGTRGVTDVLAEALHIARMGRRVMGWEALPAPKGGAIHHFEMPGARHGYMSEESRFETRGAAAVENVKGHSKGGSRSLRIAYRDVSVGRPARVSTPIWPAVAGKAGPYTLMATPRLYPGMAVTARGSVGAGLKGPAEARLFVRHYEEATKLPTGTAWSRPAKLAAGKALSLTVAVPDAAGWPVQDLGIEIRGEDRACGEVFVDSVAISGAPSFDIPDQLPLTEKGELLGWIQDANRVSHGNFTGDGGKLTVIEKNEGRAIVATGTTDWSDYAFEARAVVHLADRAGIVARYQGLRRYIALVLTRDNLRLILNCGGETVLGEIAGGWKIHEFRKLRLECSGKRITAWCDGRKVLDGLDDKLGRGGAGFLCEVGLAGFREAKVRPV